MVFILAITFFTAYRKWDTIIYCIDNNWVPERDLFF